MSKATLESAKNWGIGSIVKKNITTKEGKQIEISEIKFNKGVEILVDGKKLNMTYNTAALFKSDDEKKHENLLKAEAQYNFKVVRDIVAQINRGDK